MVSPVSGYFLHAKFEPNGVPRDFDVSSGKLMSSHVRMVSGPSQENMLSWLADGSAQIRGVELERDVRLAVALHNRALRFRERPGVEVRTPVRPD
jgi:hypothetical protein